MDALRINAILAELIEANKSRFERVDEKGNTVTVTTVRADSGRGDAELVDVFLSDGSRFIVSAENV